MDEILILFVGGGDDELEWYDKVLCVQIDLDVFFFEKGGFICEVKCICEFCEVCQECLEYVFVNDERFGIWGGLFEMERCWLCKWV